MSINLLDHPDLQDRFRSDVARLRLQRMTESDIASRLTVDYRAAGIIPNNCAILREYVVVAWRQATREWQRMYHTAVQQYHTENFAELNQVGAEAWTAWERSKKGTTSYERLLTDTSSGGSGDMTGDGMSITRMKQTVYEAAGDPRFLEQVMRVIKARTELLGDVVQLHDINPRQYDAAITPLLTGLSLVEDA